MSMLRGTLTVLVTPFTADGSRVDLHTLKRLVSWQISQGIHGLVPLGSTGEFLSVSRDERQAIIECCVAEAAGRVPVYVGTGAEATPDAVELSREAEALGADGVMVIPPFYSLPTEDELFEHYRKIGEAISIPIMIYNNPAAANVDILPPMVARLAEIDAVRSIKESSLEITRVRDIIELCDIDVFAGVLGFESFWLGAVGWVAVCSNLVPYASARIFELAVDKHDPVAALAVQNEILPLIRWCGGHRYVSATKAGLAVMGLPVGPPRPPRLPLPQHELSALSTELERMRLARTLEGLQQSAGA